MAAVACTCCCDFTHFTSSLRTLHSVTGTCNSTNLHTHAHRDCRLANVATSQHGRHVRPEHGGGGPCRFGKRRGHLQEPRVRTAAPHADPPRPPRQARVKGSLSDSLRECRLPLNRYYVHSYCMYDLSYIQLTTDENIQDHE